jgi:hypothetical protein
MPEKFEGFGISVMYPDSWQLDSEVEGDSVSIESPEGAFLSITKCGATAEAHIALLNARQAMHEEYEEIEQETLVKEIANLKLTGEILRFVVLDLIVTSQLLLLNYEGKDFLIQTQAEDREHDRLQPVFDAILTSFCQHLQVHT